LASKFSPQINALNESGSGVAIILRANRGYDSDGVLCLVSTKFHRSDKSAAAVRSTGLRLLHFSNPEGFRGY